MELVTCIDNAFKKIEEVAGEDALTEQESHIRTVLYSDEANKKSKIEQTIKDCMLRMPGKILIDVDRTSKFFSIADERAEQERSDGTKTFAENILVPPEKHELWNTALEIKSMQPLLKSSLTKKDEARTISVHFFPITGEPNYREAINLFEKLLLKKGTFEGE